MYVTSFPFHSSKIQIRYAHPIPLNRHQLYTLLSIPVVSAATSARPYFPLNSKNTKTSPTKRPCGHGCANNRNWQEGVHSNCSERLWLHTRTVFRCPGELSWLVRGAELKQFRTCRTYASSFSFFCPRLRQNANTTESSTKFGNIVRVETSRYLTKIMTLRKKADRKQRHSLRLPCTAGGNQAKLKCTEFEIYGGGVEAGHAHGCSQTF